MARVPRKKVSEEKKLGPVPFPVLMDQGNPKLKVVLKFGKKATLVSSSPPPQPVNKLPPRNFVLNEPEKPEAGTFALFSDVKKPATTAKPVIKTEERQKPENNNHLKRKRIDDEEEYDFDAELKEKQKAIDQSNRLKITVNPSKKMKMNFSNFSTPTQPSKQSHNNNNNTNPQQLRQIIRKIMQQLIKIDQNKIFMDPVTDEMAPGYSTMITTPMCFKMMMEAESNNKYDNIQKFEFLSFLVSDFQQMCANCLTYNLPESPFYQDGVKMREEGLAVIQRILGYIPETNIKPTTIDNAQRQSLEMELSAQNEEKEKKEVKEGIAAEIKKKKKKTSCNIF